LITASASGEMAHKQLILIMKTLEGQFDDENLLLIQGVRGKINEEGKIINSETLMALNQFIHNFENQFLNGM
jgi:chromate reductase